MPTATAPVTQAQAQLPDPKLASEHLHQKVRNAAFFGRLAQRGINVTSAKQASQCLELADKLRTVESDPRFKVADDRTDPFARANAALDQLLGTSKQSADTSRQRAVMGLMNDPGIYNSVLSLKCAEAAQVADALQASA